jgi:hypothetical protein
MSPSMGGGGPSAPKGGSKPKPKADPDQPETHAAAGSGDSMLPPSTEPSLPAQPTTMTDAAKQRIGSDQDPNEQSRGQGEPTQRDYYGLYYREKQANWRFQTLFPFWAERTQPSRTKPEVTDRASLFGGLYYNRRSAERSDDILFPLVWNLRDREEGSRTTVVGPLVQRTAPGERDNWLAPLYFTGKRKDGGYTLIPPLLTYSRQTAKGGFTLVGPGFCSWKGGTDCDARTAERLDLGVAPLYFFGQDSEGQYEAIPPLLHYYSYSDRTLAWTNLWGPYLRRHTQEREMLHVLPLYWSIWGKDERHTTVLPFFHQGRKGKSWLHINPLFLLAHGEDDSSTFVTWGYARHRGRTELDMITPLYWSYRDPDRNLEQKLLFPFLYSRTSPRESTQAFFPFWSHSERYGVSETTWVTPFIRHSRDLRGWSTSINPVLFLGRDGKQSWTVVAPFFWDFVGTEERATVGFPFYWRFSDRQTVTQLVGNVYYQEKRVTGGSDWQVHIFPAFSYGETPNGHWWNLLYGLAGYKRRGDLVQARALWIPITLSGKE